MYNACLVFVYRTIIYEKVFNQTTFHKIQILVLVTRYLLIIVYYNYMPYGKCFGKCFPTPSPDVNNLKLYLKDFQGSFIFVKI